MKVCHHKGLLIAVLTRNEHCPPHVHVGTADWDARFEFSFWHNGVTLWDVTPEKNEPSVALLEELRQVIKQRPHLKRAREAWWVSRQTLCMDNMLWDVAAQEAVSPRARRANAYAIASARFEATEYRTKLKLTGNPRLLEIAL